MEVRGGRLGIQMGGIHCINPPLQFPILGADLTVEGGGGEAMKIIEEKILMPRAMEDLKERLVIQHL